MNVVTLMGRLTSNPELKTTNSGVSVTSFTLAVDRAYTPKGQERQTDFINCVAWRNTAEFITRYFRKGGRMAVKGELQSRSYTANDGSKRTLFEVVVDGAFFCESKQAEPSAEFTAAMASVNIERDEPKQTDFEEIVSDEELPF